VFNSKFAVQQGSKQSAPWTCVAVATMLAVLSLRAHGGSLITPTISAGVNHTCATTEWGTGKCWGINDSGQLGDGYDAPLTSSSPVDVLISSIGTGITQVAAGYAFTCGVTGTSAIACWGNNYYGELGTGDASNNPFPYPVFELSSGMIAVTAGDTHACALTSSGAVKCWGSNGYGQLGNNTDANSFTPVNTIGLSSGIVQISAGGNHTCALTDSSELKCWGSNLYGESDGSAVDKWTPSGVAGITTRILSVSSGGAHTCAVTSSHGIKCWGLNSEGQLGDGRTILKEPPVDVVGLASGAVSVASGMRHTCALLDNGHVECWGNNGGGQLGNGSTVDSPLPLAVSDLPDEVVAVTAGENHTCVVTKQSLVKCWGFNIANGADHDTDKPIDVPAGLGDSIFADGYQ
jgi:alpha-tubulin suppressor-like RCC1 family protein